MMVRRNDSGPQNSGILNCAQELPGVNRGQHTCRPWGEGLDPSLPSRDSPWPLHSCLSATPLGSLAFAGAGRNAQEPSHLAIPCPCHMRAQPLPGARWDQRRQSGASLWALWVLQCTLHGPSQCPQGPAPRLACHHCSRSNRRCCSRSSRGAGLGTRKEQPQVAEVPRWPPALPWA